MTDETLFWDDANGFSDRDMASVIQLERAAYLRGLEDAAKVAENWNSHVSELTAAIRALAKEG